MKGNPGSKGLTDFGNWKRRHKAVWSKKDKVLVKDYRESLFDTMLGIELKELLFIEQEEGILEAAETWKVWVTDAELIEWRRGQRNG